jgi:Ca-activated chloride channel family protein
LRNDRVGLVVFAEAALIACPLTLDYPFVQNALKGLNTSLMPKQGTAVGEAIGLSLLMLDTLANSGNSAIVLVTDGASNRGVIGPLTAADLARQRNVRVYAIGVGDSTIQLNTGIGTTNRATEQDLAYLQTLANHTGGRFWRATQPNALAEVFREIEQLERATVGSRFERLTVENYRPYALAAFICACAAFLALGVGMANPLEH